VDDLLNRDNGRGVLNLVLGLLGIGGGMKVISAVVNKVMDRGMKRDEYEHADKATSEERAWKRVNELEEERRKIDIELDNALIAKYDSAQKAWISEQSLTICTSRLESQMKQNTELCEQNAHLREKCEELQQRIHELERRG
jgi:hypothetical protein